MGLPRQQQVIKVERGPLRDEAQVLEAAGDMSTANRASARCLVHAMRATHARLFESVVFDEQM